MPLSRRTQNDKRIFKNLISEGKQTNSKNLYKIECEDSRGIENAWPAFLFAPTSHSILYKFLLFCLLAPDEIKILVWKKGGTVQKSTIFIPPQRWI